MAQPLERRRPHHVEHVAPAATVIQQLVHLVAVAVAPRRWVQAGEPVVGTLAHVAANRPAPTVTIRSSVFIFAVKACCPASVRRYGLRRSSTGSRSIQPCCSSLAMAP